MNMLLNLESPVTTAHRAKLAYIYVRQSTAGQVRQHQESTELQYRLVDRAALFGWPKERIEVIDDDLGKSGTSSDSRGGFQRLIAEIGLGKAGLVRLRGRRRTVAHFMVRSSSIAGKPLQFWRVPPLRQLCQRYVRAD